jgi:hypothetical protein
MQCHHIPLPIIKDVQDDLKAIYEQMDNTVTFRCNDGKRKHCTGGHVAVT